VTNPAPSIQAGGEGGVINGLGVELLVDVGRQMLTVGTAGQLPESVEVARPRAKGESVQGNDFERRQSRRDRRVGRAQCELTACGGEADLLPTEYGGGRQRATRLQ